MSTYIAPKSRLNPQTWKTTIYRNRTIGGYPADEIDCMNECLNVDFNYCTLFVLDNGICYLGNTPLATESGQNNSPSTITVYSVISKLKHCLLKLHLNNLNLLEIKIIIGQFEFCQ